MTKSFNTLACNGGGTKGVITALILADIEKRTGKPICQLFDLIAGSSVGGILALLLSCPNPEGRPLYSAQDAANILIEESATIFHEPLYEKGLGILDDLVKPKYSSTGRDKVIKKYLGDTLLTEALTRLFITSYDTSLRVPIFFVSDPALERRGANFHKLSRGVLMRDAAMATSAAPSYFKPYKMDSYCLIDGGMYANNPTLLAKIEADLLDKDSDKILCSVGTGSLTRRYEYNTIKDWGILNWVEPIINIIQDAQSEAVSCQLELALPDNYSYYRFDGPLLEANDDFDDAKSSNMAALYNEATRIIRNNGRQIDDMCTKLVS